MLQPSIGLGDANIDPEILTADVDHDFFDSLTSGESPETGVSQEHTHEQEDHSIAVVNMASNEASELPEIKLGEEADSVTSLAVICSTQESTATSPNYPRPKQCYLLEKTRKSLRKCPKNPNNSGSNSPGEQFLNLNDCVFHDNYDCDGTNGTSDSELSEGQDDAFVLDQNLEFVDMLQKYFDYIEETSDCSDLTEVSPLSSTSISPLPPLSPGIRESDSGVLLTFNEDSTDDESESEDDNEDKMRADTRGGDLQKSHFAPSNGQGISDELEDDECFLPNPTPFVIPARRKEPKESEHVWSAQDKTPAQEGKNNDDALSSLAKLSVGDERSRSSTSSSSASSSISGSQRSNGSFHSQRNYSFTAEQTRKMERENQILLRKIVDTHKRGQRGHNHHRTKSGHCTGQPAASSTTWTRTRQQKKIDHENKVLFIKHKD